MTEFTKEDWQRFSLRPWEFYGRRVSVGFRPHPLCMPTWFLPGVITKKTKSNMVGVILDGDKNIRSFRYGDLAWEDEQ